MTAPREPAIDALKVLASQTIVLHHLSAYGPLGDALHRTAPGLMGWLFDDGRMAVQVFLVLGGYLAAPGLMATMTGSAQALVDSCWRRYLRLMPPLLVALVLAMAAAAIARPWLSGEVVPGRPTLPDWLAHALLLQEVLGKNSLSAGIWYVAIDFQLYALLALLLWLGLRGGRPWMARTLVVLAGGSALWVWNRHPGLDDWGIYYLGSYGLGVMARWAVQGRPRERQGWLGLMVVLWTVAQALQYRTRLSLALAVALCLVAAQGGKGLWNALPAGLENALGVLGRSSYAVFLVHFPVLLLGNALLARWGSIPPASHTALVFAGVWASSIALGWAFERWVESPLAARVGTRYRVTPP